MRHDIAVVLLAVVACKTSTARPPADAVVDAAVDAETLEQLEARWTQEIVDGRRAIDDLIGRATTVRIARTQMLDSHGIVERCGWRTLDAKSAASLRAAMSALTVADLRMAPACAFIPTLRVEIVAPDRTLRFEVCLHCSQIKGENLDFHFLNGPKRDALHEWAAHEFPDDPYVADPRTIDLRPRQREVTPCSP